MQKGERHHKMKLIPLNHVGFLKKKKEKRANGKNECLNESTVSREARTVFMKSIKKVTKTELKQSETRGYG